MEYEKYIIQHKKTCLADPEKKQAKKYYAHAFVQNSIKECICWQGHKIEPDSQKHSIRDISIQQMTMTV